ncbi:unnamed protein product (macronuclear) [Paramecium tetraurelia]|uniref:PB1 domain-containing protein n=1 Tax=Paramecium tetraurelia TaxID=5888 RepID=A0C7E6_PARTE|nr:uncharacterized protein GSPATT00035843001 [Paramecium tetraurelia]CAK66713.1 unnamed protein product [Paramecium tetraurelia]|eukprot:XP_001434110.1 hypothetical protein (macronuclear) [Paramecium tetraurelia strain d4-2]
MSSQKKDYNITLSFFGKSTQVTIEKSTTTLELYQFLEEAYPQEFEKVKYKSLKFFLPAQNKFLNINQSTLETVFDNYNNYIMELKEDLPRNDSNCFASSNAIPKKQVQTEQEIQQNFQPQDIQHQQNQQNQIYAQQWEQQQQLYNQNVIQNNNQQNQQFQYNDQTQQLNQQAQNQDYNQQQFQQWSMQQDNTNNQKNQKKTLRLQYKNNQIQQVVDETLTVDELYAHFYDQFNIEGEVKLFWQDLELSCLEQYGSIFNQGIQNDSIIECIRFNIDIIIEIFDRQRQVSLQQNNHSSLSTINEIIQVIYIYLGKTEETISIELYLSKDNSPIQQQNQNNSSATQLSQSFENEQQIRANKYNCTLKELNLIDSPLKFKAKVRYNGGSIKSILN